MTLTVLVPSEEGQTALARLEWAEAVRYTPGAAMPELPKLRMVQTLSAGTEQWEGRLPDGVLLSNARGANGGATAELAMAGLLAVYRQVPQFAADQAAHRWNQHQTETMAGKRLLVLGAGDLGQHLRAMAEPFGVTVTLVGRSARAGVRGFDELPDLIGGQDVVVVMVPSNAGTRPPVAAGFRARRRDRSVLVTVARGPVVDTGALLAELTSGRLRAVLDVTDPEPLPPDHPLWDAPGVVIFPHVGGNTEGANDRAWRIAAEQIRGFV